MTTLQNRVRTRIAREFFAGPLIDNTLRGYWCEAMVAEALGPEARIVSAGWHAWDLQIGPDHHAFPDRIRLQVKNAAARQTWHGAGARPSDATFSLAWRRRPAAFQDQVPGVPCEAEGFLCEVFVLCHHPVGTDDADHSDPDQWAVYLLPVVGPHCAVTEAERAWASASLERTGRQATTQRRIPTLERGIRGRPAVAPLRVADLSVAAIRGCLGLPPEPRG